MNYHKNDLIDECLGRFYQTFSLTLDTCDYVPKKYNDKILKYIFKCMKKSFRKIDKEDREYQKSLSIEDNTEEQKRRKNGVLGWFVGG